MKQGKNKGKMRIEKNEKNEKETEKNEKMIEKNVKNWKKWKRNRKKWEKQRKIFRKKNKTEQKIIFFHSNPRKTEWLQKTVKTLIWWPLNYHRKTALQPKIEMVFVWKFRHRTVHCSQKSLFVIKKSGQKNSTDYNKWLALLWWPLPLSLTSVCYHSH